MTETSAQIKKAQLENIRVAKAALDRLAAGPGTYTSATAYLNDLEKAATNSQIALERQGEYEKAVWAEVDGATLELEEAVRNAPEVAR